VKPAPDGKLLSLWDLQRRLHPRVAIFYPIQYNAPMITDIQPQTVRARELYGDYWFNSEPVPVSALRGSVILIHFWDYTCASCIRSLPYVKEWQKKYQPFGLTVVGVHTPRFPFGQNPEVVEKAVRGFGVRYPVVMDNVALIASNYDSRTWPTVFLIDKNGFLRYRKEGEGNYASTEHAIQTLLYDAGVGEELPLPMKAIRDIDRVGAVCYRATPEIQAGYLRGSIGNVEGYSPESVVHYADPGIYLDGRFYAVGDWMNGRDSLRLDQFGGGEGSIIFDYQAVEVGGVLRQEGKGNVEVDVRQDDRYLSSEIRGEDVRIGGDGRSFLVVTEPRLYNIVRNREYGEHVVKLTAHGSTLAVHAFSFLTAVIPELVSNN
jgi:thiol-disulfide isomerase/thioredoxin